ncbi:hypothetical protein ASG43_04045 [Aureimonas sp. Leaf454]|nr:hypothetical protein ASG43_04045 [Aureimonas sp. Leaf454]
MSGTSPDIAMAQFKVLQRQVPLLYALLSVNALAVAYTHHGQAPDWMTIGVSGVLVSVSLVRLVVWVLRRHREATAAEALSNLRRTTILSVVLAVAYISWSLSLNAYGGPYEHAHVAIFIAITVIGCIFCLMQLPQAALAVAIVVTVPYLVFYLRLNNPVFSAIALNMFLVTLVMVQVLLNSYRSFIQVIVSRGETERLSRENLRLAHTDVLTGLPNRRHFFLDLEESLDRARRTARPLAVGLVDLDRFKPVNDTYGHVVGDRLLEEVSRRFDALSASGCVMARLGGDEFGFFIDCDEEEAHRIAASLCDTLARPFQIEGITLSIGGSCGVAVYPDGGLTTHELFDHADYALYKSKSACRGSATFYSADHETKILSDRAVEAALRAADLEAEMEIHLQPIVHEPSGRVAAVEALARWNHPRLGPVEPDLFVAIAERSGLIHDLTLILLAKALRTLTELPGGMPLCFNLCAQDITNPQTVIAILALVRRTAVDPSRLTFELTETALLRDVDVANRSIRLFRSVGIGIALDDFGTGSSSLSQLHRLPIDTLKIDRSFVKVGAGQPVQTILASIRALGAAMTLDCIVEGVETGEQLAILRAIGFERFQGDHFAAPMTPDALLLWLAERNRALATTATGEAEVG